MKIVVEFFLTAPIQFIFALPFYKVLRRYNVIKSMYKYLTVLCQSAYESLKYVGRANMDLLVCLSTTAAFVYSLVISIILLVNPSLVSGTNLILIYTLYSSSASIVFTFERRLKLCV